MGAFLVFLNFRKRLLLRFALTQTKPRRICRRRICRHDGTAGEQDPVTTQEDLDELSDILDSTSEPETVEDPVTTQEDLDKLSDILD
jgi:hypothetical protein